jgi:hypothetical protein
MLRLLKRKVNIEFLANPFYIFSLSFSIAIFTYLWNWSSLYPRLSFTLLIFLLVSVVVFAIQGFKIRNNILIVKGVRDSPYINDAIFGVILLLGIVNVFVMGYIPIFDRSHDYRDFGAPVIDPLFNSLCIFFAVFFFQVFVDTKKKKNLIFYLVILIFQALIFRRSTIVWILTSSAVVYVIYKQKISLIIIISAIIFIPLLSYCFGIYGNKRSNLSESYVINDLGASAAFKNSGISYNHYITYLYLSSPLANLQKNVDDGTGFLNKKDFKNFFFYCILPQSFTMRLEGPLMLNPPQCSLIMPHLIVGTFLMVSFYTLGWIGMLSMLLYLLFIIILCLYLIKKWSTFSTSTFSILITMVSLLIFTNFLNRLDVLLILFVYPVFFHFLYRIIPAADY